MGWYGVKSMVYYFLVYILLGRISFLFLKGLINILSKF